MPQIALPYNENNIEDDNVILSHSVEDGDFAFTIRMVHDVASRSKIKASWLSKTSRVPSIPSLTSAPSTLSFVDYRLIWVKIRKTGDRF